VSREDHAIVEAVKGMTDALELSLVAEGIETPQQLDVVTSLGCDTGQGMLFAPPLPPHQATHLLRDGVGPPAELQESLLEGEPVGS
jgi:diguanylate cyclase